MLTRLCAEIERPANGRRIERRLSREGMVCERLGDARHIERTRRPLRIPKRLIKVGQVSVTLQ